MGTDVSSVKEGLNSWTSCRPVRHDCARLADRTYAQAHVRKGKVQAAIPNTAAPARKPVQIVFRYRALRPDAGTLIGDLVLAEDPAGQLTSS